MIADPCAARVAADLHEAAFLSGCDAERWRIIAFDFPNLDFAVASTFPADGESIKPIQNPGVSFNRPVDAFSLLKNASIEPAVTGYWEVNGARVVFIHKQPLEVGKTYTVKVPVTVTDLAGQALKAEAGFKFGVKDFEGAAKDNTGKEKDVALAVEAAFDAYLSGLDIALREIGVGDLSVGKKMKKLGRAFYGRVKAYETALDGGNPDALRALLDRTVFEGEGTPDALADYVAATDKVLAGNPLEALLAGQVNWRGEMP